MKLAPLERRSFCRWNYSFTPELRRGARRYCMRPLPFVSVHQRPLASISGFFASLARSMGGLNGAPPYVVAYGVECTRKGSA